MHSTQSHAHLCAVSSVLVSLLPKEIKRMQPATDKLLHCKTFTQIDTTRVIYERHKLMLSVIRNIHTHSNSSIVTEDIKCGTAKLPATSKDTLGQEMQGLNRVLADRKTQNSTGPAMGTSP